MRHLLCLCALALIVLAGCQGAGCTKAAAPTFDPFNRCPCPLLAFDRGDWMVNQGSRIWKVTASSAANRPPEHIGYLVERQYRQMRGGPEFQMYSITTLNRKEQIGHIDQLGRGVRYDPERNGTFKEVSIGVNKRELNVAGVFRTKDRITLVPTNERRLAFEALDVNGDGVLQLAESKNFGDRVFGADANGDGVVDFQEFNTVDAL